MPVSRDVTLVAENDFAFFNFFCRILRFRRLLFYFLNVKFLFMLPFLVLSICLTCHFRVTVSALLSLVGPAHQLLLPLAAFKCDVF